MNELTSFPQLSSDYLNMIQAGFDERRNALLDYLKLKPYPEFYEPGSNNEYLGEYVWTKLAIAASRLFSQNESEGVHTRTNSISLKDIEDAHSAIIKALDTIKSSKFTEPKHADHENFVFASNLFFRVYELFFFDSNFYIGIESDQVQALFRDVLLKWVKKVSRVKDTEIEQNNTWDMWGSENLHAMRSSALWQATKILKDTDYRDDRCEDGKTILYHYLRWKEYFKAYLAERAKKGLLVEIASPYAMYTLQSWYNFFDFAEDKILKERAKNILDLWWAHWAEEQLDGVRGGSKARLSQGDDSQTLFGDRSFFMSWYYFGSCVHQEKAEVFPHPALLCLATSNYRLPLIVVDIALDFEGRGSYEVKSRRMGLGGSFNDNTEIYSLEPENGGIYRYTYVTPDFTIGTSMFKKLPKSSWSNISDQNRWHGIIVAGKRENPEEPDARVYPQCVGTEHPNGNIYTSNQQWSVQFKGTLICQKLSTSVEAGDMRVWLPCNSFSITEESGWVFAEDKNNRAFIAIAPIPPIHGNLAYEWSDCGNWLRCVHEYSPIIFEVARRIDYQDLDEFKETVIAKARWKTDEAFSILNHQSLYDSKLLTFYLSNDRQPEIDSIPIDTEPDFTFDSPFIKEVGWASGIVTITKGDRELKLDFNE